MSSYSVFSGLTRTFSVIVPTSDQEIISGQDLVIKFLSAENLPKMDLFGSTDPYFIAKIDDQISYKSTILADTLSPRWKDEEWIVRNIPLHAKLTVTIYDKDDDSLSDDYIGQFEINDLINYQPPSEGHLILGPPDVHHGRFHLTIESIKSPESSQKLPRYTFDGPCRYNRHNSPSIGLLTMINTDHIYSTWTIHLRRVSLFFGLHNRQQWNRQYAIAQSIFSDSPRSSAKQNTFKLVHKLLYGRTIKNDETGRLTNANDLWKLIFFDDKTQRIRTCIYTYIIDDYTWRFSETGGGMFTDYASKHAVHANCSESVRYAGQFHPRPKLGWDHCDDEWELVFDNWSGTYAPSFNLLNNLKELLEFNFPGLNVVAYDYKDPLLEESMNQLQIAEQKGKRNSVCLNQLVFNPSMNTTK